VPLATAEEVLGLYQKTYYDLNVRHFHEKLNEEHGIQLSYTWVQQALQGAGLVARGRRRGRRRGCLICQIKSELSRFSEHVGRLHRDSHFSTAPTTPLPKSKSRRRLHETGHITCQ